VQVNTHQIFYHQTEAFDRKHGCVHVKEECGILLWDSELKLLCLWQIANSHPDPRHHFAIKRSDANQLIDAAIEAGLTPVGVFHTHVEDSNPDPSPHDIDELVALNRINQYRKWYGVVYHSPTRRLTYYTGRGVLYVVTLKRNSDGSCLAEHRS
jgi:proteasome lid subunit RPN8/RPN11